MGPQVISFFWQWARRVRVVLLQSMHREKLHSYAKCRQYFLIAEKLHGCMEYRQYFLLVLGWI
jgi:hypothetical protein